MLHNNFVTCTPKIFYLGVKCMNQKLYRFTVLVLVIALVFTSMPLAKRYLFVGKQRIIGQEVIVKTRDNGNVEAINTVDNTTLKVKYTKEDNKYTLYRDEVAYDLAVSEYGKDLFIDLEKSSQQTPEGKVVGQFAIAIPVILWTPVLIEAAQVTIAAAVAAIGTYTIWYSVDSIAQTIEQYQTKEKVVAKEVAKEDTKKNTAYYAAALVAGQVAISRQLTYEEAVLRLSSGMDVFATNKMAASAAAFGATVPGKKAIHHLAHDTGEGFYPHFHPGGRQWIVNPNNAPHCWYGVTPVQ